MLFFVVVRYEGKQEFEDNKGVIKNGQSRDTVNTNRQSGMDNPEILSTLRGDQEWRIQRYCQH